MINRLFWSVSVLFALCSLIMAIKIELNLRYDGGFVSEAEKTKILNKYFKYVDRIDRESFRCMMYRYYAKFDSEAIDSEKERLSITGIVDDEDYVNYYSIFAMDFFLTKIDVPEEGFSRDQSEKFLEAHHVRELLDKYEDDMQTALSNELLRNMKDEEPVNLVEQIEALLQGEGVPQKNPKEEEQGQDSYINQEKSGKLEKGDLKEDDL